MVGYGFKRNPANMADSIGLLNDFEKLRLAPEVGLEPKSFCVFPKVFEGR